MKSNSGDQTGDVENRIQNFYKLVENILYKRSVILKCSSFPSLIATKVSKKLDLVSPSLPAARCLLPAAPTSPLHPASEASGKLPSSAIHQPWSLLSLLLSCSIEMIKEIWYSEPHT